MNADKNVRLRFYADINARLQFLRIGRIRSRINIPIIITCQQHRSALLPEHCIHTLGNGQRHRFFINAAGSDRSGIRAAVARINDDLLSL